LAKKVDPKCPFCYTLGIVKQKEPEMKTATTIQFRNAVRKAGQTKKANIAGGWTDGAERYENKRYVCLYAFDDIKHFAPSVAAKVAKEAERILNAQGVTANTRSSRMYIRGTCVL